MNSTLLRSIGFELARLAVYIGGVYYMATAFLVPFMVEKLAFRGVIFTDGPPASTLLAIYAMGVLCVVLPYAVMSLAINTIDGSPKLRLRD